jgi:hypothetical protein
LSLKENVKAIKEELNAEEQFLEGVIKAEGFWKKYKGIVIGIAVVAIVAVVSKLVMEYMHESSLQKSNIAYAKLLENGEDKSALDTLKSTNPKLYEIYIFKKNIQSKDVDSLKELKSKVEDKNLKDLISYQIDSISKSGLAKYAISENANLKEFALYESAYMLLKDGKIKDAHAKLDQISKTSSLYAVAQNLKHYMSK